MGDHNCTDSTDRQGCTFEGYSRIANKIMKKAVKDYFMFLRHFCTKPLFFNLLKARSGKVYMLGEIYCFGIAFSHHGPPEKMYSYPDILDGWPKTAGFLNTRGIKLFIHGHGHERKVDKFHIKLQTIEEAKGTINQDEILRVMAPTTHLDGKKRPDGQLRGFNIITLHRVYGKVTGIEVASYEFGDSMTPAPMDGSPWKCVV